MGFLWSLWWTVYPFITPLENYQEVFKNRAGLIVAERKFS
jgi:hypothetical protein